METNTQIYWKDLVELLKKNQTTEIQTIDFRNEEINAVDVALLNRNGYRVPEHLIFYDDNEIDFSDDPEITDDDYSSKKVCYLLRPEIEVSKEVNDWIKDKNIDLNLLLSNLLGNFHSTLMGIS